MEASEIVLTLVGIISTGSIFVIKNIMIDIKELEHNMVHTQSQLPEKYVMKTDYKDDIKEIKSMLGDLYDLTRNKK